MSFLFDLPKHHTAVRLPVKSQQQVCFWCLLPPALTHRQFLRSSPRTRGGQCPGEAVSPSAAGLVVTLCACSECPPSCHPGLLRPASALNCRHVALLPYTRTWVQVGRVRYRIWWQFSAWKVKAVHRLYLGFAKAITSMWKITKYFPW